MIPIILGGAAAVSAFKFFKPKCINCISQLTLNKRCAVCNELVCGNCGADFEEITYKGYLLQGKARSCKQHVTQMNEKIASAKIRIDEEIERDIARQKLRENAEQKSNQVHIYSKNYKGLVETPKLGKTIKTGFFNDKESAEHELKVLAAMDECFIVQSLVFNNETQSDGNYKYKVWSATGVI